MNNNNKNVQHLKHQRTTMDEEDESTNGDDSIDDISPPHIRYEPPNTSHSPHALALLESSSSHALYASSENAQNVGGGEGVADQLTLTFQGQVYVFDSVSPEKVQAVLLLLGGYELPSGIPTPGMTPQSHRSLGDYPTKSSQPQRAASLNRFREKRKERCFDKKIRYTVRKEVALRMQRKKGQFTSAKSVEERGSSADWNGSSGQEEQETLCRHCGTKSKSTPMMRRGPDGPRTLCNACGLKWANKGVLRELTRVPDPIIGMQPHRMQASTILNGDAHGENAVVPAANVIISSNGGS